MSVVGALLRAQAQSVWNRTRAESGLGGPLATAAIVVTVAAVLAVPGYLLLRLGLRLGDTLAVAPEPVALDRWNAVLALFTVGFAALGSFRHRPAFTFAALGRFPVGPLQRLLAEIPAACFEAFSLLAGTGIVAANVGLAIRLPAASPCIALLTVQGLVVMVSLLLLAASVRRWLLKRPSRVLLALGVALGGVAVVAARGPREVLREELPALLPWLPGSQGYRGLLAMLAGDAGAGLARIAASWAVTLALLAVAAWAFQREQAGEARSGRSRLSGATAYSYPRPALALGRLFLGQLLDSRSGRALLLLPALFTVPLLILTWAVRYDAAHDQLLSERFLNEVGSFGELPLLALFLLLIVLLDANVWMNQFGWDRAGVRTLLLLPIAAREVVAGKLLGLTALVALQGVIGGLPLLWVLVPALPEAVAAVATAGSALLAAAAVGILVSARFPRPVAHDGGAAIPLALSWVPTVVMAAVSGGLMAVHQVVGQTVARIGPWAPPAAMLALLALAGAAYALALPTFGEHLAEHRERLLTL